MHVHRGDCQDGHQACPFAAVTASASAAMLQHAAASAACLLRSLWSPSRHVPALPGLHPGVGGCGDVPQLPVSWVHPNLLPEHLLLLCPPTPRAPTVFLVGARGASPGVPVTPGSDPAPRRWICHCLVGQPTTTATATPPLLVALLPVPPQLPAPGDARGGGGRGGLSPRSPGWGGRSRPGPLGGREGGAVPGGRRVGSGRAAEGPLRAGAGGRRRRRKRRWRGRGGECG